VNNRTATRDTILPRGGGIDGDELLFLPAGTVVGFHTYSLHRLKDIYGADAEDFRPERWEDVRPGWAYLPFSGGPRVCLGQRFALTQAAYLTVRLLQEFPKVDVDQYRPWRELLTLVRFPYDVKSGMLARVL
jgi:cytochrome P450